MTAYQKKPEIVDAWQWMYSTAQEETPDWATNALWQWPKTNGLSFEPQAETGPRIVIAAWNGDVVVLPGDWLIRGENGDLSACEADRFLAEYEPVAKNEVCCENRS